MPNMTHWRGDTDKIVEKFFKVVKVVKVRVIFK